MTPPSSLDHEAFQQGIAYVCSVDADLGRIVAELGHPPMWARTPGFPTLVHIILEQQVSLASARAAFTRLEEAAVKLTPERFLAFTDSELKTIGFSRQKTHYCRELAKALLNGNLDLAALERMDDAAARSALVALKGIGAWTADIYLLMAMLRPDVWPVGDLALISAVQETKSLPARPGPEEMEEIAAAWRPWRAVAARILWHFYLSRRR